MRFWLRRCASRPSSYTIVYDALAKAFRNLGYEVHTEEALPQWWSSAEPDDVEFWWGSPLAWNWQSTGECLRVAYTVSEHHLYPESSRREICRVLRKADLLFAPSRWAARAFEEMPLNMPIMIAPHGVDRQEFPSQERDFVGPLRFLHAGVAQWRKGSWLVPEAFVRAFGKSKDVHLTITTAGEFHGSPQDRASMFHQVMRDFSSCSNMTFTPVRDSSPLDRYVDHDVLVHPHLAEGFGLCVLEAMSTGMPALVSRCSAPREFFSNEVGRWIEMSQDAIPVSQCGKEYEGVPGCWRVPCLDSLAKGMRYMERNRGQLVQFSHVGPIIASAYTWENTVEAIVSGIEGKLK